MTPNQYSAILFLVFAILLAIILVTTLHNDSVTIADQPSNSLQLINNTSQTNLQITLQIFQGFDLWQYTSGNGRLSEPIYNDFTKNPPNYQMVTLNKFQSITVRLPDFTQPWRVTPYYPNNEGMPTLIEGNRDVVTDMSVVDGCNYLLKMELTANPNEKEAVIDFNTSPCDNPKKPCINPYVNGLFAPGTNANSTNCYHGTCNLIEESRLYCSKVHNGQCNNVDSKYPQNERALPCQANSQHGNRFGSYCISTDDQNNSPTLVYPYKIRATYIDLK